jgi:N-acetyl-gamma-glutamyl-phosphate reductase
VLKAAIMGATAYTSLELIDILLGHPEVTLAHLGGRRKGNPRISSIFPTLRGRCDMEMGGLEPRDLPEGIDVVFFTLPHGVSQDYVPRFLDAGLPAIDFSADYRLRDLSVYEGWYGEHADPGNVEHAAYGIPELFREQVRDARLVANPGCYPTSALMGLAPLADAGMVEPADIIVDAKSGVSGRGNKPDPGSMYCECNENLSAYKVGGHRHQPEIAQGLDMLGMESPEVFFTPHLAPMDRGIQSSMYVNLDGEYSAEELEKTMRHRYADEPFVTVRSADQQPRTKDVAFTNRCHVAAAPLGGEKACVTSVIDNLTKGASSQAVQNMNVMFDLPEDSGLR